jgi:hypothetical protein
VDNGLSRKKTKESYAVVEDDAERVRERVRVSAVAPRGWSWRVRVVCGGVWTSGMPGQMAGHHGGRR